MKIKQTNEMKDEMMKKFMLNEIDLELPSDKNVAKNFKFAQNEEDLPEIKAVKANLERLKMDKERNKLVKEKNQKSMDQNKLNQMSQIEKKIKFLNSIIKNLKALKQTQDEKEPEIKTFNNSPPKEASEPTSDMFVENLETSNELQELSEEIS